MSPVNEMVGFTVRLKAEEHEQLRKLAEHQHRSLGAQARIALLEHLAIADAPSSPAAA